MSLAKLAMRCAVSRRGFTLIELLVVITIVAIMIGLLLPAVQQAREAARRTVCRNNLKQLGLALQNYHSAFNSYPLGGLARPTGASAGAGTSFFVSLLPYADQQPLYSQFDFGSPNCGNVAFSSTGHIVNGINLPMYRCPSSPLPSTFSALAFLPPPPGNIVVALPSYVGVSGAAATGLGSAGFTEHRLRNFSACFPGITGQMSWGGVLLANQHTRMTDITDGTTNVMTIAECSDFVATSTGNRLAVDGAAGLGWTYSTNATGTGATYGIPPTGVLSRCANLTTILSPVGTRNWPSNSNSCTNLNPNRPILSAHAGGAHVALCDGSVRFLSDNIDVTTLKRLATRDDGQSLGEF